VLMRIDRLGRDTRFAQIVALMEKASTDKPRLAILADRIAAPFLVVVVFGALLAAAYWWQVDHSKALAVAVAVLIVTCPCALSLATPAAMLASAGALARRGVLVRRLQAFETLSTIDAVVFDKTGTLTEDRLVLRQVRVREGVTRAEALQVAAALAQGSLHPVSRALARAAQDEGLTPAVVRGDVREAAGKGMEAFVGAYGRVRLGAAAWVDAPEAVPSADGGPEAHLADDAGWLASFELAEGLREDAAAVVQALQAAGIRTWLLSGDRDA